VHASSSGSCTWHEFARAIADRAKPGAEVEPVLSAEYARPARRPAYSVLDKSRYEAWTGHRMPSWEEGLEAYLAEIGRMTGTPPARPPR
jgi:dTDP-4-dehydrorhamnose reductase